MKIIIGGIAYFILANLISFITMGSDKRRAKTKQWRIPEQRLFALALLGGSPGILMGMYHYRHKTKHITFVIGIPAILVLQIIMLVWAIGYII